MGQLEAIFPYMDSFPTWIEREELFHYIKSCDELTKFDKYWDGIYTKQNTENKTQTYAMCKTRGKDWLSKNTKTLLYTNTLMAKIVRVYPMIQIAIILWIAMTAASIKGTERRKEKLQVYFTMTDIIVGDNSIIYIIEYTNQ